MISKIERYYLFLSQQKISNVLEALYLNPRASWEMTKLELSQFSAVGASRRRQDFDGTTPTVEVGLLRSRGTRSSPGARQGREGGGPGGGGPARGFVYGSLLLSLLLDKLQRVIYQEKK